MLVGFRGEVWAGGAFESNAATPEEAAEEVFQKVRDNFPEGPNGIREATVTDFPRLACVLTRDPETGKWIRLSEADMRPFAGLSDEDNAMISAAARMIPGQPSAHSIEIAPARRNRRR